MLFRVRDRLDPAFGTVPPTDDEIPLSHSVSWDVYCVARLAKLGYRSQRQRRLYHFRNRHGFTDVADAAFDRVWAAPTMTYAGIRELCKETGAADRGPSKVPVDILRQK